MEILSSEFPRTEGVTGESPAKGHYNVKGTASSFQWKKAPTRRREGSEGSYHVMGRCKADGTRQSQIVPSIGKEAMGTH